MYQNIQQLVELAETRQLPLWRIVLESEMQLTEESEEEIFAALDSRYAVMESSAGKALKGPLSTSGGLIEGVASRHFAYSVKDDTVSGGFLNRIMAMALSSSEVNASMGRICAAPTAGSCGILPAVLIGVSEKYQLERRRTLEGLLVASGVGAVIMKNATVSGAEGGCQAECGVAAAMAAAAVVQLRGGASAVAANAVAIALINCMGLVCDPIAGLVQVPCAQRNASQAINALTSADLALGGMTSLIPADEVIEAMYKVGKRLPSELKETAEGGIAATPTGRKIAGRLQQRK